ncbi:hypothetical protein [Pseudodesulfovibrio senegalensis]|uniref:Uncharacterized protein n=1 Tax=Pseudodesulfovibrio senegalensis TaxID=1721087 RepID=A0A6N6MX18_9BACT|nr:hypothetical protein [Pseudodesulfovibrio senegalensis]KAB1437321.1 hypothetical protein F8A88_15455 [Pseudodesulfovibrio senegalensis]
MGCDSVNTDKKRKLLLDFTIRVKFYAIMKKITYKKPNPVLTIPLNFCGMRPNVSIVVFRSVDFSEAWGAAADLFRVAFRVQKWPQGSKSSPYVRPTFAPGGRNYFFLPMDHVSHMARYILHRGMRIPAPSSIFDPARFYKGALVRAAIVFRGEKFPVLSKTRIASVVTVFGVPCFSLVGDTMGYRALHEIELI